ncbi:MAG: uracil-DNA glycosylase [Bacilli bacterium]|nr:uracil-DNA glycosylase [Bacilli bacterium]MBP3635583.1 uracil-DNA glycosylase [Bacilli bacterium]
MKLFNNDWDEILNDEIHKEYFLKILYQLRELYKVKTIYPEQKDIFNAFKLPYKDVKVVILGQDPYHGEGEAHGYAFSTHAKKLPPSLKNIYKELYDDLKIEKDYSNGDLTGWQKQGVMLLNTGLTVEKDKPNSHKNIGWHTFTDIVIQKLNEKDTPVVFILWGNNAREKKKYITNPKHLIIESAHPSPFSCDKFFGSRPFSRTNDFLEKNNINKINW